MNLPLIVQITKERAPDGDIAEVISARWTSSGKVCVQASRAIRDNTLPSAIAAIFVEFGNALDKSLQEHPYDCKPQDL